MPQQITDVAILQKYIDGVMDRAEHHAGDVNQVVLALAGAIIWKKDSDPIEVFTREGEMKNVLWVKINGNRYAFTYNHDSSSIELREGSTQGNLVDSFSNTTPISEIIDLFSSL